MSSDSHSTFNSDGFMFKLGHKTSKRFARGILVCLLPIAVAFISSVKVNSRSRFSLGNLDIKVAIA